MYENDKSLIYNKHFKSRVKYSRYFRIKVTSHTQTTLHSHQSVFNNAHITALLKMLMVLSTCLFEKIHMKNKKSIISDWKIFSFLNNANRKNTSCSRRVYFPRKTLRTGFITCGHGQTFKIILSQITPAVQ